MAYRLQVENVTHIFDLETVRESLFTVIFLSSVPTMTPITSRVKLWLFVQSRSQGHDSSIISKSTEHVHIPRDFPYKFCDCYRSSYQQSSKAQHPCSKHCIIMSRIYEVSRDGRWVDEESKEATESFYDRIHLSRPSSPQSHTPDNKQLVPYHEDIGVSTYDSMNPHLRVPEPPSSGRSEPPPRSSSSPKATSSKLPLPSEWRIQDDLQDLLYWYLHAIPPSNDDEQLPALTGRKVATEIWLSAQELTFIPNGELAGAFHSLSLSISSFFWH